MERWLIALLLTIPLGVVAWRGRVVTVSGALSGIFISTILATTETAAPVAIFIVFVILGSAGSKLGAKQKTQLGVMQKDNGRRTWWHAWANAGPATVAVVCALIAERTGRIAFDRFSAELFACGSIGAMLADTIAGEWGTYRGGRPRSIVTMKSVPIGTDGGVTMSGLGAAALMAVLVAGIAASMHARRLDVFVAVATASFCGNLADSILGATIEPHLGPHSGAKVNFTAATIGGFLAAAVAST